MSEKAKPLKLTPAMWRELRRYPTASRAISVGHVGSARALYARGLLSIQETEVIAVRVLYGGGATDVRRYSPANPLVRREAWLTFEGLAVRAQEPSHEP